MSELESLLVLVAAIYLSECGWWIPRDAFVVRAWWGSAWRVRAANAMPGGALGAVCALQPLPALGSACVVAPLPVSLSDEGVLTFAAHALPPERRTSSVAARWIPWSALQPVRANDARVEAGGVVLARSCSPRAAQHLAQLLERLRVAAAPQRNAILDEEVAQQFDFVAIGAALGRAERATLELRVLQPILFALVFVAVPYLWIEDDLLLRWKMLVAAIVALTVWIAVRTWLAARVLRPDGAWKSALLHLVSPLAAMRARETLMRDALALHHPLAVAKVVCDASEVDQVVERALRDARSPFWPECPLEDDAARRTERAWRERMRRAIAELSPVAAARAEDLPIAEPGCVAYCARCREQFTRADRACARCGERPSVPFEPVAR